MSWINITPGQKNNNNEFISLPLKENGYDWIKYKSIHWGPGLEFDPRNPDRIITASGNGLFACDNIWDDKNIQFYFDPKGIEETVPIDMVSVKNGNLFVTILDYDGFIYENINELGKQFIPNMKSTGPIAICNKNPNIMFRIHYSEADLGYYSEDSGKSWKKMGSVGGVPGGKGAITEIGDEKYRFLHAIENAIMYSDNYGKTWQDSKGVIGENFGIFVEESDPMVVYSYSYTKKSSTNPNAENILGISGDGGKTFSNKVVCRYDGSNFSNRIAYLGKGKLALSAGNNGLYIVSNFGKTIKKVENVEYCKTVGFGAPEHEGDENTLYIYGRPLRTDPEGVYRSQDDGNSWILINHEYLYGGTGNGNFVVGDMNNFGTLYMSSLGCGIIYGKMK